MSPEVSSQRSSSSSPRSALRIFFAEWIEFCAEWIRSLRALIFCSSMCISRLCIEKIRSYEGRFDADYIILFLSVEKKLILKGKSNWRYCRIVLLNNILLNRIYREIKLRILIYKSIEIIHPIQRNGPNAMWEFHHFLFWIIRATHTIDPVI